MIKKIKIKNFRSILESEIDLQNFTVIVGANATGKSNLIKAIDFISDITKIGLQEAIYKRGGFPEILPKQHKQIYNHEISLEIEFIIDPPEYWIERKLPPLTATYKLAFLKTKRNTIKITQENLKINSILLLAYYLDEELEDSKEKKITINKEKISEFSESKIEIFRNKQNNLRYNLNLNNSKDNAALFVSWIGVKRFFSDTSNKITWKNTNIISREIFNMHKDNIKKNELTILSNNRAIFGFSAHLRQILSDVQSYGRYDLLINELRQEQPISSESGVSISGDNIPSIIKKFSKEHKRQWNRILTTMSNISPYFENVKSESLRAGKEYLVFSEIFKGRGIESWESSDGTLRALAILISIESHESGSTLLIEEPEHGIHPWAVKELISHIREVVNLRKLQVILTTHSQQVLENIEKTELLITERDKIGTHYSTINSIIPDADISMGEIGELWTRGLLNGVPKTFEE